MRTLLTSLSALVFLACPVPATAGVVYNWVELEGNSELGPMVGRLVVRDDVWLQGSWSAGKGGPEITTEAQFGLESFYAFAPAMGRPLTFEYRSCSELGEFWLDLCLMFGHDPSTKIVADVFAMNFSLTFGDLLSGVINGVASPSEGYAQFFGTLGNPISIVDAGNDMGDPCGFFGPCRARGVWLIDRSTIPVPEPSTVPVLLAALLLVAISQRRANRHRLSAAPTL